MNRHCATSLSLIICGLLAACASVSLTTWHGYTFQQVDTLAAVPAPIRQALHAGAPGLGGIADKGEPFNAYDNISHPWPFRRFVGAGHDGSVWLIIIQRGGFEQFTVALLFSGTTQQYQCVLQGIPKSFMDALHLLRRNECSSMQANISLQPTAKPLRGSSAAELRR